MTPDTLVAFVNHRCFASGAQVEVLARLKQQHDADPGAMPLVFERLSGRQVDFDLRGSLDEVLARAAAPQAPAPWSPEAGRGHPRGDPAAASLGMAGSAAQRCLRRTAPAGGGRPAQRTR